jgi:hypothetical protein
MSQPISVMGIHEDVHGLLDKLKITPKGDGPELQLNWYGVVPRKSRPPTMATSAKRSPGRLFRLSFFEVYFPVLIIQENLLGILASASFSNYYQIMHQRFGCKESDQR